MKEIEEMRASLVDNRPTIKPMRSVDRSKLREEVKRLDRVLDCVQTSNITEINDTILACANIVQMRMNKNDNTVRRNGNNSEPAWKRRLQQKVTDIGKDLDKLRECRRRDFGDPMRVRLERKYNIKNKGYEVVIEELKQNLQAKSQKIKRYGERHRQYCENRLFENNQKQFYQRIQKSEDNVGVAPESGPTREFWQEIWSVNQEHNENATWMTKVRDKLKVEQQQDLEINADDVSKVIAKVPNWKAPGPDGIQGFWLKNFKSLHGRIGVYLQELLAGGDIPRWMTTGRTALVMKDTSKGNQPGNYRPITCLPLMWKTLTGIIADKLYVHIEAQGVIGEEQLGCRRQRRGTKEHLMLDKTVMRDSKKRSTNLAMGWIDYQKAYDLLPHSWIIETMKLTGMASNAVSLVKRSMETWNTGLHYDGQKLVDVDIRRGIFQGDSLSPLLFVVALIPLSVLLRSAAHGYKFRNGKKVNHILFMDDLKLYGKSKDELEALVNTVRIFTDDVRMKFGLSKCATVVMKRGKKIEDDGITMPDGQKMEDIGGMPYKYLGVLESDRIKMAEMKEKVKKDYNTRVKKLLKSRLNAGNLIKAINTWAVATVRYTAGIFFDWTVDELKDMDRKTRKLLTMNNGLHPRADVDRLYLPRREGGKGMMSIEEIVRLEECSLSDYVKNILPEENVLGDFLKEKGKKELKSEQRAERKEKWKEKALHGQYPKKVEEAETCSWRWLETGWMKRETEGLLMAAQDQALHTRNYKVKILKEEGNGLCRMCGKRNETVMHILSECEKLAQLEYKKRHDRVATIIHWELCKHHGFPHCKNWYDHRAEPVLENGNTKILWDFNIYCDRMIEARRPDIVIVDKKNKETKIIDIAVPGDFRVKEKELEKVTKYQDLVIEVNRMWSTRAMVVPIVVGALGAIYRLRDWLGVLHVEQKKLDNIQQTALLGSANILRKVLSI